MKSLSITIADLVSSVCLSVGAVGLCYSLISYWGYELSAIDRYLVVLGSIWAAVTTWPSTFRLPVRPWPLVGILAVVVASILYLPCLVPHMGHHIGAGHLDLEAMDRIEPGSRGICPVTLRAIRRTVWTIPTRIRCVCVPLAHLG